jgi:AcrR family transcriptional regulator
MSPTRVLRPVVHRSAVDELASHGYHGTDLAGIADRAGVTEDDVRAMAPDLDRLLADSIVAGYEDWRSQREDWMPIAAGESLRSHLHETLLAQARRLADPPALVVAGIALLMEDLPKDLPAVTACREHRQQAVSEMTAWLRYAIDRDPSMPGSRPEASRQCAEILVAAFEGYCVAAVVGDAPEPVGFTEVLLGLLLHALGS